MKMGIQEVGWVGMDWIAFASFFFMASSYLAVQFSASGPLLPVRDYLLHVGCSRVLSVF
jgi:hypothetical protein